MHIKFLVAVLATTMATGAFAQADTSSHNPAVKHPMVHTATI